MSPKCDHFWGTKTHFATNLRQFLIPNFSLTAQTHTQRHGLTALKIIPCFFDLLACMVTSGSRHSITKLMFTASEVMTLWWDRNVYILLLLKKCTMHL